METRHKILFGAAAVLVLLVVLILVVGTMQSTPATVAGTPDTASATVAYPIQELGIVLRLPRKVADQLTYVATDYGVLFSTRMFATVATCGPESGPVGALAMIPAGTVHEGPGDVYGDLVFNGPQAPCWDAGNPSEQAVAESVQNDTFDGVGFGEFWAAVLPKAEKMTESM